MMAGDEKMEECLELIVHGFAGSVKLLMEFIDFDIVLDIVETVLEIKNHLTKKV